MTTPTPTRRDAIKLIASVPFLPVLADGGIPLVDSHYIELMVAGFAPLRFSKSCGEWTVSQGGVPWTIKTGDDGWMSAWHDGGILSGVVRFRPEPDGDSIQLDMLAFKSPMERDDG